MSEPRRREINEKVGEWGERRREQTEYPFPGHPEGILTACAATHDRVRIAGELNIPVVELEEWLKITGIETKWNAIDE